MRQVIRFALTGPASPTPLVNYPQPLEADIEAVTAAMPPRWRAEPIRARGLALWALTSIDDEDELTDIPDEVRAAVAAAHRGGRDIDLEIISSRYALLDAHTALAEAPLAAQPTRDRIDAVLLHPVWGFGVFVATMLLMFQSLFSWADPFIGLIESAVGALGAFATATLPASLLTDLLTEGIIGGVGNVIVFLPQILLLFLFIGLMEDAGYMSRVAYLMDRIMRALGLHGQAFVPMLSGFACAVPAVMATRTMPRRRDRLLTMMVVPLMTCSARLPVYTLVIAALFPPSEAWGGLPVQGMLMMGMYLFSIAVSFFAAWALGKTVLRGPSVPLLMELPPFRFPVFSNVIRLMWQRARLFLSEAGSVILVCTVILWGLLSFPQQPPLPAGATASDVAAWEADQLAESYAGRFGHAIEPAIAPLGFDWKIGVGLVGSFAAREVFISTMGLVYGIGGDIDEDSAVLRDAMRAESRADGAPVYTPLVGMSLMVFFALACQCMSTLAVVKRETGGYLWPAFLFAYMTALAWVCSFIVYQGGLLLGLG
ncbi:MAG: ferrous iron transport protein B [Myxococcota bacterium]